MCMGMCMCMRVTGMCMRVTGMCMRGTGMCMRGKGMCIRVTGMCMRGKARVCVSTSYEGQRYAHIYEFKRASVRMRGFECAPLA